MKLSEMSNNDIRTFHLRLSRAEYEELERLQETVNIRYGTQLSKTETIKAAIGCYQKLFDNFAFLGSEKKG